jgi:hypothetical protein
MENWISEFGKWLIRIGGILVILGAFLWIFRDVPLLNKLGRLPGDIRIQNDNFTFYFPLTTSILISLVLTLILWIIKR